MQDRELDFYEWRDENANDASGYELDESDESEGTAAKVFREDFEDYYYDADYDPCPNVGYPQMEAESDSRLQQAIASAYAVYVQRTLA